MLSPTKTVVTFTPNHFDYVALDTIRDDFFRNFGSDLSISEAVRKAITEHARALREGNAE